MMTGTSGRCEDAAAGQEPDAFGCFHRKSGAAPGHDVEREVGVLPQLVLIATHVEARAVDLADLDVARAELELALDIAHRRAAIAAAARLMKHQRAVLRTQARDPFERGRGGGHCAQKNPCGLGL